MTEPPTEIDLLRITYDAKLAALQATLEANDKVYQQRYDNDHAQLKLAFETNNHRLDQMNEFRAAMQDQSARMVTKNEYDIAHVALSQKGEAALNTATSTLSEAISVLDTKIEARFVPLTVKVDAFGKPNWTLITSFLSIAALVVTGLWLVIGLKIDNSSQPLSLAIEQIKTVSEANTRQLVDQRRVRDQQVSDMRTAFENTATRVEANEQKLSNIGALQQSRITLVDRLVSDVTAMRVADTAEAAITREKLAEIETQLKSVSIVFNLERDDRSQQIGVLWRKTFGVQLPEKLYRPDLYEK